MGIKKLIDNQQIRIDSHQRGSGKANTWNPIEDVHLHKITKVSHTPLASHLVDFSIS